MGARLRRTVLLLVAAGLFLASRCPAAPADHSWGLEVAGGLSTYALDAVNDTLASLDNSLGTAFGSIDDGTGWAVALRMWANRNVLIRLSAEKNTAISTDADRHFDIGTLDATLGAIYYLPLRSRVRLGAGVAGGVTWIHGALKGTAFSLEARGSAPQFRATLEAVCPVTAGWFVNASAGVRHADVGGVKLDEQVIGMRADYSGAVFRLAVGHDWPWPTASAPR